MKSMWPGSILIENFNTPNQSIPQYAAHDSFVTNPKFVSFILFTLRVLHGLNHNNFAASMQSCS